MYASVAYTGTGRNDFGYKYGDNVQANLVYDRKLTDWLDGVVEVNFLDAKHDQVDALGVPDPDTGGQTLYITPRVGVNIVRGLVARAAVADPGLGEPERDPGHQARVHRGADVRVLGGSGRRETGAGRRDSSSLGPSAVAVRARRFGWKA